MTAAVYVVSERRPVKAADLPTDHLLSRIIAHHDQQMTEHPDWSGWVQRRDIAPWFPDWLPDKVLLAKLRNLYRRGLIDGCPCGCRGDWVPTAAGRAHLNGRTP